MDIPSIEGDLKIIITVVDNGYTVEIPDLAEMRQKQGKSSVQDSPMSMYWSDCTDTLVATDVKGVMAIVKNALTNLPAGDYDDAFDEAAAASPQGM